MGSFGDEDKEALAEHVAKVPRQPGAGYLEAYQATVIAIKANEAIMNRTRVELKEAYEFA